MQREGEIRTKGRFLGRKVERDTWWGRKPHKVKAG